MYTYSITLNKEQQDMINKQASNKNLSPQVLLQEIVNKYILLLHNINHEDMAKGYIEMSEINLEFAK